MTQPLSKDSSTASLRKETFFGVDGKGYRQCYSPCIAGVSCEAHPALRQEGVSFVTGLELTSQPLYESWGSVPSAWQCAQTRYGTSLTS